jgi:hypothetical protein
MKILLVLAGLLAAAAAGAAGAALFSPAPAPATAALQPREAPVSPAPTAVPREVQQRLDTLTQEVADLQAQLAEVRAGASRTSAAAAAPEAPSVSVAQVATIQREAILKVLADEKAAEEQKREQERLKRAEEMRLQRADRMAQRVGLNAAQERQLADFYLQENDKIEAFRQQFRDGGMANMDREQMRAQFQEFRTWRESELTRLFGPETGKQIADTEGDRFRGGPGFFGGDSQGGGQGQAQGGGGRRGRGGAAGGQGGGSQGGAGGPPGG